jgi:hypothetical protein
MIVYQSIQFHEDGIQYNNIKTKQIVFAEGFGLHANPYFNYLPLDGTKGELFIIKAPTTGYKKITIAYAVDRTSSGAQNSDVSYSIDGVNFTNTGIVAPSYSPTIDPTYSLMTYNLSSIAGVNNNPNFQFKITFSNGNLGTSGNNRFDNITVDGYNQ